MREYDQNGYWYGTAVSCFGILYNARLLKENHLPLPATWDDLAEPDLYGRIEAADASQSGSARTAYEMIIQSAPDWPTGWGKLLRIFGNCKKFTGGASDVTNDVAFGEVLAGAAIDFYAYDQIAANGDDLGFVAVAGSTAFTPDPISMLKDAPHPELARRFIEFVLAAEGQALWCLPPGAPGGPAKFPLYRQPIRKDIYARYAGKMLPCLLDPFAKAGKFQLDQQAAEVRIGSILGPLMKAAATENDQSLHSAWKKVIAAGRPEGMVREFIALPPDLATPAALTATAKIITDPKARELTTGEWLKFFRDKYDRLLAN